MRRLVYRGLFTLMLLFASHALAQTTHYGDITIVHTNKPVGHSSHGYQIRLVTITNSSPVERNVKLTYSDASTQSYRYNVNELIKETVIGPRTTATLRIPVWSGWDVSSLLIVSIDGKRQAPFFTTSSNPNLQPHDNTVSLLAKSTISLKKASDRQTRKKREHIVYHDIYEPYARWGDRWLDYSSFDIVFLNGSDWWLLNGRQREALRTWVRCGGSLVFFGSIPEIELVFEPPTSTLPLGLAYDGFGVLAHVSTPANTWDDDLEDHLFSLGQDASQPWRNVRSNRHGSNPLTKENTSLRGFYLLMIFFSILLGPLNLFLLARIKKRIWLLWTVPAISVATSFFIFLYAFVTEGFNLYLNQNAVTILDESQHWAVSLAQGSIYATLTQFQGLHFDAESEIYIPPTNSSRQWEKINLSTDQHLASGWLKARIDLHYFQRRSELRRERLTVTTLDENTLSVVNGLGVPISDLFISDEAGRIYRSGYIEAGLKGTAEAVADTSTTPSTDFMRQVYKLAWDKDSPSKQP